MKIFNVDIEKPDENAIRQAGQAILEGKIVCYPTETVYGIGGNPRDAEVNCNLNRAKGRDEKTPNIILIPLFIIYSYLYLVSV